MTFLRMIASYVGIVQNAKLVTMHTAANFSQPTLTTKNGERTSALFAGTKSVITLTPSFEST